MYSAVSSKSVNGDRKNGNGKRNWDAEKKRRKRERKCTVQRRGRKRNCGREQANGLQAESVKYRERMYSRKIDDNKIEGGG